MYNCCMEKRIPVENWRKLSLFLWMTHPAEIPLPQEVMMWSTGRVFLPDIVIMTVIGYRCVIPSDLGCPIRLLPILI